VADDDLILDIGPETAKRLAAQLMKAGTIVWNGPVGVFEFAAFENGTKVIAQAIAESDAFSIAGGGDTLAAIAKYGIEKDVGYISTGGGAFPGGAGRQDAAGAGDSHEARGGLNQAKPQHGAASGASIVIALHDHSTLG
jgi:hypothetical protein